MSEQEALHWCLSHPGQPMPPDVAELLEDLFAGGESGERFVTPAGMTENVIPRNGDE